MSASIDWRYWRISPEIQQWEACALSIGLNPESMRKHPQAWMAGPGAGPIFTDASFPNREVETEFKKRQRLLEASVFTSGFFPTVRGLVMGARWKATIRLDEFATWLAHVGLDAPPELCVLQAPVSTLHAAPSSEPHKPVVNMPEQPDVAGLSKRERQIRAIVAAVAEQGYDALNIPTGGKTTLRKQCQELSPTLFGVGPDPFDDAWKVAIACVPPRLRMADHDKFTGK